MKSIEELRRETPGAGVVAHFNNCGSALPPAPVLDAQIEHLRMEGTVGGYEAAQRNQGRRTMSAAAARLLGCSADEIAFADSASRAWNELVFSLSLQPGDEILTSRIEFGVNLLTLRRLAIRTGSRLRIVASRVDGTIDLDDLSRHLTDCTRLVAITHAAGHFGGVNPVEEIGRLVAETKALFLVDACQSLGQMPVDVDAMSCHALTASGRKWVRGPRGSGFLYVRDGTSELIDPVAVGLVTSDLRFDNYLIREEVALRSDAKRFEAWERNVAAEIGLAVALEYLTEVGVDSARSRITDLTAHIVDRVESMPDVSLLRPIGEIRSGVIGMALSGGTHQIAAVRRYLHWRGINVSSMERVDAPLDYAARGIDSVLRISPHYYNTDDEVDRLCEHLAAALKSAA
jgi:cysteine desulfurase / selenocysteine lyase